MSRVCMFATRTQVFINFVDNKNLDGMGFAPFGKVIKGMDVVDQIYAGHGESPNQGQIQSQGHCSQQSPMRAPNGAAPSGASVAYCDGGESTHAQGRHHSYCHIRHPLSSPLPPPLSPHASRACRGL